MLSKTAIKSLIISLLAMALISVLSLFILSVLTYYFKWQAPQALVGITVTYILTGLSGGTLHGCLQYGFLAKDYKPQPPELTQRLLSGGAVGLSYIAILFLLAIVLADGTQGEQIEYSRWLSIGILLVCSSILGYFLSGFFYKKG